MIALLFILGAIAAVLAERDCEACKGVVDLVKRNVDAPAVGTDGVLEYMAGMTPFNRSVCENLIEEEGESIAELLASNFDAEQVCAIVGECEMHDSMFVTLSNKEKRVAVANKIISREGKNQYTQDSRRTQVGNGYSDCSSLVWWAYKQAIGLSVGDNTEGQMLNSNMKDVNLKITNGIPDESQMLVGDQLYFRGTDKNRSKSKYVGHVETYIGNGTIMGHGSGTGPTRKNMKDYCKSRQNQSSPVPGGNRGLICVKRAIPKDSSDNGNNPTPPTPPPTPTTNYFRDAQQWLSDNYNATIVKYTGAALTADGAYGPKSRFAALAVWKDLMNRKYGTSLTPSNSSFGSDCKAVASKVTIKSGSSGTFPFIAMYMLAGKGYYNQKVDTSCGSGCVAAIKSFQSAKGLSADGICGASTWYALFN